MPTVMAPLREEHEEFLPRIQDLLSLADRIGEIGAEDLRHKLYEAHAFLTKYLMPHAVAEERVLYPAVDRLLGAPGATATMTRDHVEVVRLSEELDAVRVRLAEAEPSVEDDRALRRILHGIHALLRVHFAKEEEIYLPLLEESLSPEEADELFDGMETAARDVRRSLV